LFTPAIAPHLAAEQDNRPINLSAIGQCFEQLQTYSTAVVVEGVGGFIVPLNAHQTTADLARQLQLPVILTVGLRLGCINHALLTVRAIEAQGLRLAGWVANSIEPDMQVLDENISTLRQHLAAPFLGRIPWLAKADAA